MLASVSQIIFLRPGLDGAAPARHMAPPCSRHPYAFDVLAHLGHVGIEQGLGMLALALGKQAIRGDAAQPARDAQLAQHGLLIAGLPFDLFQQARDSARIS